MNHRTHRNVAKLLYPHIPFRTIDGVNSVIDNPSKSSKMFNQMLTSIAIPSQKGGKVKMVNPFDYYGLGNIPHRRVNHDPVTAGIMSYLEHGPEGFTLANCHLSLDIISEELKKAHGVAGRDLFEAELNYVLENMIKKRSNKHAYY